MSFVISFTFSVDIFYVWNKVVEFWDDQIILEHSVNQADIVVDTPRMTTKVID